MLDQRQLQALLAVLEESSFERAAQRLHITQSAVSQRIKQLEERLGQALLIRSNPIRATAAGQRVYQHARQLGLLEDELRQSLSLEGAGRTRLSIGLNADSLSTWFLEALEPLLTQHDLLLDLKVDDQDQTHHLLRSGEVQGCVSASARPIQGCRCVPLGLMRYRAIATPEYRQRHFADGLSATAFRHAPLVAFNVVDDLQRQFLRAGFGVDAAQCPTHRVPSSEKFVEFIGRGHAWGMAPEVQVAEFSARFGLVDLAPDKFVPVPLYWHVWGIRSALLDALTEALLSYCRAQLAPID